MDCIDFLKKFGFDMSEESYLVKFYTNFQKAPILFIKVIKDKKIDIRNLNEFIVESAETEIQISDIENLIKIYNFFMKILDDKDSTTDEILLTKFNKEFIDNKIYSDFERYQQKYGEIIRIYKLYEENPVMTINKIQKILKKSKILIYRGDDLKLMTFQIELLNKEKKNIIEHNEKNKIDIISPQETEYLRNKILLSMTTYQEIMNNEEKEYIKEEISKDYINLIDQINHLIKSLNNLIKLGYPHINNFYINIINSEARDENKKSLEEIKQEYMEKNKSFISSLKKGYEKHPLLRLFYGQQFIQLFEKCKYNKDDISNLINSVTLNKIKIPDINYIYNKEIDELENINNYLEKLFLKNNINIHDIYNTNKVIKNKNLSPGLYRKTKSGNNNDIVNINILNIYFNLTNNHPITNTLLICNEQTSLEKIEAFLYQALFCDKPILFVISNMECLDLYTIQKAMKILKYLYFNKKKKIIKSYLLFIYKKVDTGLARDIENIIPEQNILNDIYMKEVEMSDIFDTIEIYSSDLCGYGKSTEIIYKVKENNGIYYYLPIGGSFNREYLIKNLINLNINLELENKCYIHIDLSDTDEDNLMSEILFKLLVLRYIDSLEKIYYLGYSVHLLVEIPNGFVELDKKYKILTIFKRKYIETIGPLRLEENIKVLGDSPISIVAEVLSLYKAGTIKMIDIDLNAPISKEAKECEMIINEHYEEKNKNYYQKMNYIKILSELFKKFTISSYLNYAKSIKAKKTFLVGNLRAFIISNYISSTKEFTNSPFDYVLSNKINSVELFGVYDNIRAIQEGIKDLSDKSNKNEIFSFDSIKHNLVFFNHDKQSVSIITNADKNQKEYKMLKLLWNSNNPKLRNYDYIQLLNLLKFIGLEKLNDLVDYKNLDHESFLGEIKKLFSLNNLSVDDLKKKCEENENYIFVADNFIKMVRILLNIEAKIPVILMGETGVGKTKLLEMLSILYGKGKSNFKKYTIHAGITNEDIVQYIEKINKEVIDNKLQEEIIWIFFDEINTCNSLGLLSEIICKHTCLGKKISDNYIFLGACNPYRKITKKMKESGLIYYNNDNNNKYSNLVYSVNILPHSLLNFIFDFGSLQKKDEEKYIYNSIKLILSQIEKKYNIVIDEDRHRLLEYEIVKSIIICHDFIRNKFDESSVSLRDIKRMGIFFDYFVNNLKEKTYHNLKSSLNMTLYLCYYLRLNDKNDRKELAGKLNAPFRDFLKFPLEEVKSITKKMNIGPGIALNRTLRENLFTCYTCINNSIPLIIVGKPGTGKSLSFQILYNTMQGEYSKNILFRNKGKLYRYYYQGSEASTSEGIEKVFKRAYEAKEKNLKNNGGKIIPLVIFR